MNRLTFGEGEHDTRSEEKGGGGKNRGFDRNNAAAYISLLFDSESKFDNDVNLDVGAS